MVRCAVFVSALATSVELAQNCAGTYDVSSHPLYISAVRTGRLTVHINSNLEYKQYESKAERAPRSKHSLVWWRNMNGRRFREEEMYERRGQ